MVFINKKNLKKLFLTILFLSSHSSISKNYIVYSITQDISMGEKNEIIQKNYYVNIGSRQGVKPGTSLNVYRKVTKKNFLSKKEEYNHKIKIATLNVIHSESSSSIANLQTFFNEKDKHPRHEIEGVIIGDHISINTN